MSGYGKNNYGTTIIHGKSVPKKPVVGGSVLKDQPTNTMNAKALETKIDNGDMALHPEISTEQSTSIRNGRNSIKNGEKTLTQKELAIMANQYGGKGVVQADIAEMESGKMRLTTINKLKIQAVLKAIQFNK
jgi:hypothetical protein